MSTLVSASSVTLRTPDDRVLLEDFSHTFTAETLGLVGPNGAGKSTLLKALAGDATPARGSIQAFVAVKRLAQLGAEASGDIAAGLGIGEAIARLERITAGTGAASDLDSADWTLPARAEAALARFGLAGIALDRRLDSLSGGQRARVLLASAWLAPCDLLLMDEPTNNLDAEGRSAVHHVLREWPGGIVVATHDRELLNQVDRILALEPPRWSVFGGAWSAYVAERDAARVRAERAFGRAEAALKSAQRASAEAQARRARRARAGKAQRADGSQPKVLLDGMKARSEATAARLSRIAESRAAEAAARLETADAARSLKARLNVKACSDDAAAARIMVRFDNVSFAYGARAVLSDFSFRLGGRDRLAIEGPNGSGKSTILKLAEGRLKPAKGVVQRGPGRIARLDQAVGDLDPDLSLVDALRANDPTLTLNDAYAALAQFDIRNRDADKAVRVLSGGERLRAGLASVLGGAPPALLLLDEPTNHLDLDAIEALERALQHYEGAFIAVSHDLAFLDAIGVERPLSLSLDQP